MRPGFTIPLDRRGLTLIEILVASAVTAILGSLSYAVLMTTLRTQDDSLAIQQRYHSGRISLERMRRELTMAFVSLHQAEDGRTVTLFEGDDDRVVFNTAANEPLSKNARHSDQLEVAYFTKSITNDDGDRVQALIRRVKFHIDDNPDDEGREEVLVEGVEKFEMEYFNEFDQDWKSDWDVRVDDAIDMRQRLKEVQALRDQLQDVADDEGTDLVTSAVATELESEVGEQQLEALDGLFLPSRVRMRLTLATPSGGDFLMETQVEIPMTEPLWY